MLSSSDLNMVKLVRVVRMRYRVSYLCKGLHGGMLHRALKNISTFCLTDWSKKNSSHGLTLESALAFPVALAAAVPALAPAERVLDDEVAEGVAVLQLALVVQVTNRPQAGACDE